MTVTVQTRALGEEVGKEVQKVLNILRATTASAEM